MKFASIKYFAFFTLWFMSLSVNGQIQFENISSQLGADKFGTFPVGFNDVNGDYRDDLIQLPNSTDLKVYLQTGEISRLDTFSRSNIYPDQIWTVCAGDLNNDGIDEIMLSGNYNDTRIYNFVGNGYSLSQVKTEPVYAQGSNMIDINTDGYLDLFVCHDDGTNLVYMNDQSGNLEFDNSAFNFDTTPASDNSGNYGSEWVDYDDDGDLDLYITKCRQDVLDNTDPRRINQFFENNGNGTFSEIAASLNLDIGWQSWVAQWGDVDNDGDLDCYLINHDHADQLIRNVNGTFQIEEMFTGELMFGSSIQAALRDFDNDGDLDVLISGPKDYMLWNDGTGAFTTEEEPFGPLDAYSASIGDINDDGFLDVFTTYGMALGLTSLNPDDLFRGIPNNNNYIKFSLKGVESNLDGVGVKLMLFGDWGVQRRDMRNGESYGIVNSSNANFGLANHSQVDSLVVFWPSGQKDVILNPEINKNHLVTEGVCAQAFAEIEVDGDLVFCPGDSVVLSINTMAQVSWSDGQQGSSIIVKSPGSFHAKLDFGDGCTTVSNMVYVEGDPDIALPRIDVSGSAQYCPGAPPILSVQDYDFISWSTGDNGTVVFPQDEGWIYVEVQDSECGSVWRDSVFIEELMINVPSFTMGDSIDNPGTASLIAQGDSIHWYENLTDTDPVHFGESYDVDLDMSTNFYVANVQEHIIPPLFAGEETHTGATFYSSNSLNAAMIFDAFVPFRLSAVSVYSDMAGEREIELRDESGTVLQSRIVNIDADVWTRVALDFDVPQGENYFLATNGNTNFQSFGFTSPRLLRSFEVPLAYPMILDNVLQINQSSFGTDYFYYFYNWEIHQGSIFCESERIKVQGIVGGLSNTDELENNDLHLYPNPTTGDIYIMGELSDGIERFEVFDLQGRLVSNGKLTERGMSLNGLPNTNYLVKLFDANGAVHNFRILKTN